QDIPLLDELRYALGDVPAKVEDERDDPMALIEGAVDLQELTTASDREYAPSGRAWTAPTYRIEDDAFAHILIDEAQDLTPMQWRMVGRRGRAASWTIVGDPAQSSWPVPAEAEQARAAALDGKAVHAFHLSKNYRNSAEIYAYAAEYARRVGLDADLPEAVRSTGVEPEERVVPALADGVRAAVTDLAGAVEGTVAVVVAAARRSEVQGWLASWPEHAADAAGGAEARIPVLTGLETKGLEFDGIVVVEPGEIEAESATGRATLYVVYTRATQRMASVREG
ncbi:MAG: UvrD-helicase domain-containing protein, partial [Nocardioides sp.]|nr:UvrD-helicase domain-containing protein [Nocardioides sp.]